MIRTFYLPLCLLIALLALAGCRGAQTGPLVDIQGQTSKTLTVSSAAFKDGATIPTRFTCSGEDISPALAWSGAPENTKSLALVFDDPDAGNPAFTHWLLANIPATEQSLGENTPRDGTLSNGAIQGQNDFTKLATADPVLRPATRITTISPSTRSTRPSRSSPASRNSNSPARCRDTHSPGANSSASLLAHDRTGG